MLCFNVIVKKFKKHLELNCQLTFVDADASIRDHSGKKPMQYLVRQDTMSMESFKSEFAVPKVVLRNRSAPRRGPSIASNFSYFNPARLSNSDLPVIEVSLPTCNSNSTTPNFPLSPNEPSKQFLMPDMPRRSPSFSLGPVKLLQYGSLRKKRDKPWKTRASSSDMLASTESVTDKGLNNCNPRPSVSASNLLLARHEHLKNTNGMRSSFRRGIKKMVDSW